MERLFPSSDDNSNNKRMHLTNLLACYNDIIANAKASMAIKRETSETKDAERIAESEQWYFARVICGHMYEALKRFETCRNSGMIQEYRPLVNDGENLYKQVIEAIKDTHLSKFLEENRNKTFHYHFDTEMATGGHIVFGQDQTAASSRFLFIEDALRQKIGAKLGFDESGELDLHKRAMTLRSDLLRFVDRFVATICERHGNAFSDVDD